MNCTLGSVKTVPSSFLLQSKLIWLAVLSINYWLYVFNATRFHFFKKFLDISFYWFILKSYHIILTLMATIVLANMSEGSSIKISEKKRWYKWLHNLLAFFYRIFGFSLYLFFYVFIAMPYWLLMQDKHPCPHLET